MKGTNPDGSKYADPVSWVSYFTAARPCTTSRGAPTASSRASAASSCRWPGEVVWPYLTYGTLVTVTAP